jgi:hypothetical protein
VRNRRTWFEEIEEGELSMQQWEGFLYYKRHTFLFGGESKKDGHMFGSGGKKQG